MASHVAYNLQGKNLPTFRSNSADHNQYCIIINSDSPLIKGKTKTKVNYSRRHTGYPGGLKEIKWKDFIIKDSPKFVKELFILDKKSCTRYAT